MPRDRPRVSILILESAGTCYFEDLASVTRISLCFHIHHHLEMLVNAQLQMHSIKIHEQELGLLIRICLCGGRCWQAKYFVCKVGT